METKLHPAYEKWKLLEQAKPQECDGCFTCKPKTRDYTKHDEPVEKSTKSKRVYGRKTDLNWRME